MHRRFGGDESLFQASDRHDDLIRRAWRILGLDSAVLQWFSGVFEEAQPVRDRDPVHKHIGIIRWLAHHGEDLTITRVHYHDRACLAGHLLFDQLLEPQIEGEHEIHPRSWLAFLNVLELASEGIDFDLSRSLDAA